MLEIHNKVLDYLLEYKKEHNNFTFATRVNDRHDRLTKGYWFLGNKDYMFVPLFKRGDDANKTKTIGLVYQPEKSYIEITYRDVRGIDDNELRFYEEVVSSLPTSQQSKINQYRYNFPENDLDTNIKYYIEDFRPKCIALIKKYNLEDKYLISENDFQINIQKIDTSKAALADGENISLNYKELFRKWWYGDNSLQRDGSVYAQGTKDSYFRELDRLSDGVLSGEEIFTITNMDKLDELYERLTKGDLQEYNKRLRNTDPSNGLKQYIKFHHNREKKYFAPGDTPDSRYVQNVNSGKKFWLLGASWDNHDMSEEFIAEDRWENGYSDKYIDEVNSIREGDFVAIKSSYVQKNNLPFNNRNQFVSVMKIKAVGEVVENTIDGKNIKVAWDKDFKPRVIYIYTYRSTISNIDHERLPEVPHWIFYGYEQDPKFLEKITIESNNLILEEYLDRAKVIFKNEFPSFLDFNRSGEEYLEREYDYKKEMLAEAKNYFGQLTENNFNTMIHKVLKPTSVANFFNWRDISVFTDLGQEDQKRIAYLTNKFIIAIKENCIKDEFDLIVDEISSVISEKNVVWLYITYILFVFDYKKHMAMKSSFVDDTMKFFGKKSVARAKQITYKDYLEVINFTNEIEALLEDWKPRDMIDIHSFLWVISQNMDAVIEEEDEDEKNEGSTMNLNTILYGPPGTGKTYHTINKALKIIDPKFYENNKDNRVLLNEKFEEYKKSGQIVFMTFHQSYGYEEFIEGIRANTNDDTVSYSIEDGSFKLISDKALENYRNHQNYLKSDSHEQQMNIELLLNDYSNHVSEELEKGNEVSITPNPDMNSTLLGIVNRSSDGSFRSFSTSGSVLNQSLTKNIIVRDFQNFVNGKIQSYQDIEPRYDSQSSYHGNAIYYFELYEALKSFFDQNEFKYTLDTDEIKLKSFVLIIDEINRGNISKIFGELITLIEPDKRLGADESASIILPYSQDSFTVPNNLHLVGTMNTADRSIALLDTALRRRFEFVEMMPKYNLDEISTSIEESRINLQEILRVINERIEYLYDRDHTIGHAYFIGINTRDELDKVMRNKIIPLLQEYFYDDWEKIQIVLGDHHRQLNSTKDADSFDDEINEIRFVQSERKLEKNVIGFDHDDIENEQVGYRVKKDSFAIETYKKIYEKIKL